MNISKASRFYNAILAKSHQGTSETLAQGLVYITLSINFYKIVPRQFLKSASRFFFVVSLQKSGYKISRLVEHKI